MSEDAREAFRRQLADMTAQLDAFERKASMQGANVTLAIRHADRFVADGRVVSVRLAELEAENKALKHTLASLRTGILLLNTSLDRLD